jgi:hypothetical protein
MKIHATSSSTASVRIDLDKKNQFYGGHPENIKDQCLLASMGDIS